MGHGCREGKRNYHFNNREMDSLYSLFLQLTIKTDTVTELNMCPVYFLCVFTCVCERFLFYVCKHACFVYFKASHAVIHFTEAPIFTMGDWLFDCFQGVSAKSLFCDYCLIICPPKHTTISRFHRPGWSGGWALDWQLVNYVISILLGKWRSDNSWLVGERGTVICYGWCVVNYGWRGESRKEELPHCPVWGETEGKRGGESVWPALHCVY